jgi:hypothetical protein
MPAVPHFIYKFQGHYFFVLWRMTKPKKNSGNKNEKLKPVASSEKGKGSGISSEGGSGVPESYGGSREGNIGHESTVDAGRGDRQV